MSNHRLAIAIATGILLVVFIIASLASVMGDVCSDCHGIAGVFPGIIDDWEGSEHYSANVSCITCHQADPSDSDAVSHNGYTIAVVVTPDDCAQCHATQAQEFQQSLHSFGALYYEYLFSAEMLPYLEGQIEGGFILVDGEEIVDAATLRGCRACHGTNMTGKSADDFTAWPNNGIGRINPDGSMGSCSACHSRHTFSIEEARHPETCGQCHMGPDHPHIEIFMESKHGNIYSAEGDGWNWGEDDWAAGIDYRAPTCAGCHMSAAPGVPATHDVSSRLSWELEPAVSRHTDNIANSLEDSFGDGTNWTVKRDRMKAVCQQCHSTTWVENFYTQADIVVDLYNQQYAEALAIVNELREDGLLTEESFDEPIEFKLYEMWHHEGRRARMGAFMMGPDYVQWHGFYELLKDKVEIEHMAEELRSQTDTDEKSTWVNALIGVVVLEAILLSGIVGSYATRRRMGGPGKQD